MRAEGWKNFTSFGAMLVSTVTPQSFGRGPHHVGAAHQVQGDRVDAEPLRLTHRVRDRLRDVVELEIEENLAAVAPHDVHGALPVSREQLQADLVPDDRAVQGFEEVFLLFDRVDV